MSEIIYVESQKRYAMISTEEDLRDILPEDVYEVVAKLFRDLQNERDSYEEDADRYESQLQDLKFELEDIIDEIEKLQRIRKDGILSRMSRLSESLKGV